MAFQWLTSLFKGSPRRREAQELYISLVQQSRNPFFYTTCGVADTLDGRFDLIVMHVFLALNRPDLAQDEFMRRLLLEALFEDMDRSLREMGVGDMGVGKRARAMSKAAFGRFKAYLGCWADETQLREALVRNIYRGEAPAPEALDALVNYMRGWTSPAPASHIAPAA